MDVREDDLVFDLRHDVPGGERAPAAQVVFVRDAELVTAATPKVHVVGDILVTDPEAESGRVEDDPG